MNSALLDGPFPSWARNAAILREAFFRVLQNVRTKLCRQPWRGVVLRKMKDAVHPGHSALRRAQGHDGWRSWVAFLFWKEALASNLVNSDSVPSAAPPEEELRPSLRSAFPGFYSVFRGKDAKRRRDHSLTSVQANGDEPGKPSTALRWWDVRQCLGKDGPCGNVPLKMIGGAACSFGFFNRFQLIRARSASTPYLEGKLGEDSRWRDIRLL